MNQETKDRLKAVIIGILGENNYVSIHPYTTNLDYIIIHNGYKSVNKNSRFINKMTFRYDRKNNTVGLHRVTCRTDPVYFYEGVQEEVRKGLEGELIGNN